MSYTPTNWATGDVITAAKLNHMEDGIADDSLFFVTITYDEDADDGTYISSATSAEIVAADEAGKIVVVQERTTGSFLPEIATIMGTSAISGITFGIGVGAGGKNLSIHYWVMDEATNKWTVEDYYTSVTAY